jgi:hypothetical protein
MGYVAFLAVLAAIVLGPLYGADSRRPDPRGWWPGRRNDDRT